MNIGTLVDYIILFGALCVAISNIYKFFAKPTSTLKKKAEADERERISAVLKSELPEIISQYRADNQEQHFTERQRCFNQIREEILSDVKSTLEDLKNTTTDQGEILNILVKTSKDILREKIMGIYHKNKRFKTMEMWEREALNQYYFDYKAQDGNSYIDKYYSRMEKWDTTEDNDELL